MGNAIGLFLPKSLNRSVTARKSVLYNTLNVCQVEEDGNIFYLFFLVFFVLDVVFVFREESCRKKLWNLFVVFSSGEDNMVVQ